MGLGKKEKFMHTRVRRLNLQHCTFRPILHIIPHLYGLNYLRSLTRPFCFPSPLVAIFHHHPLLHPHTLVHVRVSRGSESAGLTNTFTTYHQIPRYPSGCSHSVGAGHRSIVHCTKVEITTSASSKRVGGASYHNGEQPGSKTQPRPLCRDPRGYYL